jgi:hypothetical protein
VAEKVVAHVLETVQQQVAEAVQDQAEQLQKKVEQIVIEKVAETVEKKPRRFSSKLNSESRRIWSCFKSLSGSHNAVRLKT